MFHILFRVVKIMTNGEIMIPYTYALPTMYTFRTMSFGLAHYIWFSFPNKKVRLLFI